MQEDGGGVQMIESAGARTQPLASVTKDAPSREWKFVRRWRRQLQQ